MPLKPKLKRTIQNTAIIGVATISGFGTQKAIDNHFSKKAIDKSFKNSEATVDIVSNIAEIKELNKNTNIGNFYFLEEDKMIIADEKIKRVNLGVVKLRQINDILPETQRKNINDIIQLRIRKINTEIKNNPKLRKTIEQRIGVLDYKRYLLSLPLDKLSTIFSKKEIEQIKNELSYIPKEKLKEIQSKLADIKAYSLLAGIILGSLVGKTITDAKQKKEDNFHFQ
ncbi:MAG: hypothetical protein WCX82_02920 [archaeon]|jgi:hypothetical protein